jgi:hypothetical protein
MIKRIFLLGLVMILSFPFPSAAGSRGRCDIDVSTFDSKSIDLDDGVLSIEHEDRGWIVEITEDYELFVNGIRIRTDRRQRKLLRRYYRDYEDIEELAGVLAREGARIGVEGAKLGVSAAACAAKLLLEDYDYDDMEDEIEDKAAEIEKMAEKLERKAEKIEDIADDLEKTHRKLRRSVPELGDLEDF